MTAAQDARVSQERPLSSRVRFALYFLIASVPFAVSMSTPEAFRAPKSALFETSVLILTGVAVAALLCRRDLNVTVPDYARLPLIVGGASVAWTGVVTLTARYPTSAFSAPLRSFCYFAFAALVLVTARRSRAMLYVILVPAAINAAVAILQWRNIWNPFPFASENTRLRVSGFVGNPHDVSAYLLLPCLAATAGGMVWRRHRVFFLCIAGVLALGMVATESMSAFAGLMGGALVLVLMTRDRTFRGVAGLLLAAACVALLLIPRSRSRLALMATTLDSRTIVELSSNRAPAFVAAAMMFAEHPLLGAGPGAFATAYMDYRLRVDERFPEWFRTDNENFGETHNDHLQLLAEGGLPAYLLFLTALGTVGRVTFVRQEPADEYTRFARAFALPAAVSLFIASLAQFALHLTAPLSVSLYLAATTLAWSTPCASPES